MLRHRHLTWKPGRGLREPLLQLFTGGDDLRLWARPRAQLGAARAGPEEGLRLRPGQLHYRPADHHLAVQRKPAEDQARVRVGERLRRLGRAQVGDEDETALVDALEEYGAGGGLAGRVGGGQRHRVRLRYAGGDRVAEPG